MTIETTIRLAGLITILGAVLYAGVMLVLRRRG